MAEALRDEVFDLCFILASSILTHVIVLGPAYTFVAELRLFRNVDLVLVFPSRRNLQLELVQQMIQLCLCLHRLLTMVAPR